MEEDKSKKDPFVVFDNLEHFLVLRKRVVGKCPYFVGGYKHECSARLVGICFLFQDGMLPDYCKFFEGRFGVSVEELDVIWKIYRRKKEMIVASKKG